MKNILIVLCLFSAMNVSAQNDFDDVVIKTTKLTESIYMLEGSGGNIGVCIGEDGVFIIDDQFAALSQKISSAIKKLSDKPVQFVINTHYHGDHAGGNQYFGESGAIIFSHENARKRIEADLQKEVNNGDASELATYALPKVTLKDKVTFHYNDEVIDIFYKGNGHTDGDVVVYFSQSNVFHMGDLFVRYGFPYVDMGAGGDVAGMVKGLDYVLSISNDSSKFIPGHGQMAKQSDVKVFRNMLDTIYKRVKAKKSAGVALEEIIVKDMIKDYEDVPGNSSGLINAVYNSAE